MSEKPEPQPPEKKKSSPALALVLAFLPSVMCLTLAGNRPKTSTMEFACAVSVVCCFTASTLLYRRKTALAISAGFIFLLLNLAISFLFGCAATFNGF